MTVDGHLISLDADTAVIQSRRDIACLGQRCLGEVMREQRRFGCSGVGKLIAQNLSRANPCGLNAIRSGPTGRKVYNTRRLIAALAAGLDVRSGSRNVASRLGCVPYK